MHGCSAVHASGLHICANESVHKTSLFVLLSMQAGRQHVIHRQKAAMASAPLLLPEVSIAGNGKREAAHAFPHAEH